MNFVKHIIYCITLGLVAYQSLVFLEPINGSFAPKETYIALFIKLPIFILAFIISDLWLHSIKMRIMGIIVLACFCLFSVKEYRQSNNDMFSEQVELGIIAPASYFENYWKFNGLLIAYLILGVGVSRYIINKKNW